MMIFWEKNVRFFLGKWFFKCLRTLCKNVYLRVCWNKLRCFATCAKIAFRNLINAMLYWCKKKQVGAVKGRREWGGGAAEGGRLKTAGFRALLRAPACNMESPRSIDEEGCTGLSSVLELGRKTWQGHYCCITTFYRAVLVWNWIRRPDRDSCAVSHFTRQW
jgi:hypothetical protein